MIRIEALCWVLVGVLGMSGCESAEESQGDDSDDTEPLPKVCLNEGDSGCADVVVAAPGASDDAFSDPELAVNGVRGCGAGCGGVDVYSLKLTDLDDGYLDLRWTARRVTNGPGVDFVVFENGFLSGGDQVFMDPIAVFLSIDREEWLPWPVAYNVDDGTEYLSEPDLWEGFAGLTPVFYNEEEGRLDPFSAEAGGDGFDLARLSDEGLAGEIKRDGFVYLRLMSAAALVNPSTGVHYPADAISNGSDIDGVYGRYLAAQ